MELSSFNVGDRYFHITVQDHPSDSIYISEDRIPLIEIDPDWEASNGWHWSDPTPDSYNISLTSRQLHPFFEEESLFLENVIEKKVAILKAIATIQSLVAAGLL